MAVSIDLMKFNKKMEKFITPKESQNPVEKALFTPKFFFANYEKNQELLFPAIKYSFQHHFDNNAIYHRLCEIKKITPDAIKSKDDINKIPLILQV